MIVDGAINISFPYRPRDYFTSDRRYENSQNIFAICLRRVKLGDEEFGKRASRGLGSAASTACSSI